MWAALVILALAGAAVSFVGLIVAVATRRTKKRWFWSLIGCAVLFVVGLGGVGTNLTPEQKARYEAERKADEAKARAEAVRKDDEGKARVEVARKDEENNEQVAPASTERNVDKRNESPKATQEVQEKGEEARALVEQAPRVGADVEAQPPSASDSARVKVSELLNRVKHDREMIASIMKESKYSDQWLLSYYEAVGSAQSKVQSEGELGDKDLEAEVAALGSEAASAYRRVRSDLSLVVKERSGRTFFGGKSKYDLILKNDKNSGLFADNYQVKKVDVDVLLSEPIFGVCVQRIRISFGSIEPGDTSVEEVLSDFSGLKIDRAMIYPRKAEKKGMTYDSNVFDL